jgi:hypothetical protein
MVKRRTNREAESLFDQKARIRLTHGVINPVNIGEKVGKTNDLAD